MLVVLRNAFSFSMHSRKLRTVDHDSIRISESRKFEQDETTCHVPRFREVLDRRQIRSTGASPRGYLPALRCLFFEGGCAFAEETCGGLLSALDRALCFLPELRRPETMRNHDGAPK